MQSIQWYNAYKSAGIHTSYAAPAQLMLVRQHSRAAQQRNIKRENITRMCSRINQIKSYCEMFYGKEKEPKKDEMKMQPKIESLPFIQTRTICSCIQISFHSTPVTYRICLVKCLESIGKTFLN